MLQSREVGAVLAELNVDGVTTSMLLTLDGAILACAGAAALPKSESAFAVVIANMWNATEACAYGAAAERGADGTTRPPFVADDEGLDLMLFELEVRRCASARCGGRLAFPRLTITIHPPRPSHPPRFDARRQAGARSRALPAHSSHASAAA